MIMRMRITQLNPASYSPLRADARTGQPHSGRKSFAGKQFSIWVILRPRTLTGGKNDSHYSGIATRSGITVHGHCARNYVVPCYIVKTVRTQYNRGGILNSAVCLQPAGLRTEKRCHQHLSFRRRPYNEGTGRLLWMPDFFVKTKRAEEPHFL